MTTNQIKTISAISNRSHNQIRELAVLVASYLKSIDMHKDVSTFLAMMMLEVIIYDNNIFGCPATLEDLHNIYKLGLPKLYFL